MQHIGSYMAIRLHYTQNFLKAAKQSPVLPGHWFLLLSCAVHVQLRHIQDTMSGVLHQLPIYHTSPDNPLNPLFEDLAAVAGGTTTKQKDLNDMLRVRRYNLPEAQQQLRLWLACVA